MEGININDLLNEEAARLAKVLCAFRQCPPETQEIIYDMAAIFADDLASEDEKSHATDVITEALFPDLMDECVRLDESRLRLSPAARSARSELDAQESAFAEKLRQLMTIRGISQETLARESGVSQSAISNMLNCNCRPQRRTILRFAEILQIPPEEIWPEV